MPTITVSPPSGPPGMGFDAILGGFTPFERLSVYVDGIAYTKPIRCTKAGKAEFGIATGSSSTLGPHTVVAKVYGKTTVRATGSFTLANAAPIPPDPTRPTRVFDADYTGTQDASIAWENFLAGVPSGYDVHLRGGRLRLSDRSFYVRNKTDIRILADAPLELFATRLFPANHELVYVKACKTLNISGPLTITGTHANPGASYSSSQPSEFQAGVGIFASDDITVSGATVRRNYGDGFGVYAGASNVWVTDCAIDGNGRWGACVTDGHHVVVQRLRTTNLAGYMYEIEADAGQPTKPYECYFDDGTHTGKGGMFFALAMYGGSHHIYVRRNRVIGTGNYGIWSQVSEPKQDLVRNADLWFEDNSGEAPFDEDPRGGNSLWTDKGVLLVAYADRVSVQRNTQPVIAGRGMHGIVLNHATPIDQGNSFPGAIA